MKAARSRNFQKKEAKEFGKMDPDIWFKRKSYGYGWTPVTKEGWTVVALHVALVLLWADLLIKGKTDDPYATFWFFTIVMAQTGLLIWISWWKGER